MKHMLSQFLLTSGANFKNVHLKISIKKVATFSSNAPLQPFGMCFGSKNLYQITNLPQTTFQEDIPIEVGPDQTM